MVLWWSVLSPYIKKVLVRITSGSFLCGVSMLFLCVCGYLQTLLSEMFHFSDCNGEATFHSGGLTPLFQQYEPQGLIKQSPGLSLETTGLKHQRHKRQTNKIPPFFQKDLLTSQTRSWQLNIWFFVFVMVNNFQKKCLKKCFNGGPKDNIKNLLKLTIIQNIQSKW